MQISTAPYCHTHWSKIFPFLRWWTSVNRYTLRADLLAGAVIVLPQGVAFPECHLLPHYQPAHY